MPKTLLGEKYAKKPPQIDWLWAAILERKMRYKMNNKELAEEIGVSYETMCKTIVKPTREWSPDVLEAVCKRFGIKLVPNVNGSTPGGAV